MVCPLFIHPWHLIFFPFLLIMAAVVVVPYWQIFSKAGFNGALAFLMVVPLVNLVMLYVLAFSQWKVVPAQQVLYPPVAPPPPPPV